MVVDDPTGEAVDPIEKEGDIVENIKYDPHIHLYQKKIEEVLLPVRKSKGSISNAKQIPFFATTNRKEQ